MHKAILNQIKEQSKLKGAITPCYNGLNLVNLSNTILDHFKAKAPNALLQKDLLPKDIFKDVKHIVLFVLDGLGYNQLLEFTKKNPSLHLKKIIEKDTCIPLTTVCPSTTAAALTSVNTALTPTQHSMVGYNLFLKEFGAVSNMMQFKSLTSKENYTSLGVEPRGFFPIPTIYQRLLKQKVRAATLVPSDLADSGLSQMTHFASEHLEYISTAHMCTIMKKQLLTHKSKKTFTYMYTPLIDELSHGTGGKSDEVQAQIANIDFSLAYDLLNTKSIKDTLLLITADHGFMKVDQKKIVHLLQHEMIIDNLTMMPTGESRFVSLYVKQGKLEMAKRYCEEKFSKHAWIMTSRQI